jgi:micrococcal nuclease
MSDPRYHYRCRLLSVVDGDTLDLEIDLGFHMRKTERVRLAGVNTPELRGRSAEERAHAQAAVALVRQWCGDRAQRLLVKTEQDSRDKFGRMLATLLDMNTGEMLQGALMAAGLAVAYDGKTARQPWGAGA